MPAKGHPCKGHPFNARKHVIGIDNVGGRPDFRSSPLAGYLIVAAREDECLRGRRNPQLTMLAFIDLEERVPTAHPLRTVRRLVEEALSDLSSVFDSMYAKDGRPSIPVREVVRRLNAAGIPAVESLSAGTYLCNYVLYTARRYCEQTHRSAHVGFIHLPLLPEQAAAETERLRLMWE